MTQTNMSRRRRALKTPTCHTWDPPRHRPHHLLIYLVLASVLYNETVIMKNQNEDTAPSPVTHPTNPREPRELANCNPIVRRRSGLKTPELRLLLETKEDS